MNPIDEMIEDGKIDASEFDEGIKKLSESERTHLMKEILQHPLIHSRFSFCLSFAVLL